MNREDTDCVRQLLLDVLATHTAKIDGKFDLIKQELGQIKEQTIKTNGRVNRHDEAIAMIKQDEINHFVNCPVESRVKVLEALSITEKGVNAFKAKTFAIIVAVATILIAYLEFVFK